MRRVLIYLLFLVSVAVFAQQPPAGDETGDDPAVQAEGAAPESGDVEPGTDAPPAEDEPAGDEEPAAEADESAPEEEDFKPDDEISEDFPVPLPSDI